MRIFIELDVLNVEGYLKVPGNFDLGFKRAVNYRLRNTIR